MTDVDEQVKFISKGYKYPVTLQHRQNRIFVVMPYNKSLIEEIKAMEGAKWHGYDESNPRKVWSIAKSQRNRFQLEYLMGNDPYTHYDEPLKSIPKVPRFNTDANKEIMPREYQFETVSHIVTRKQCIIAEEMGLGKTLSAILAIEYAVKMEGITDWWVVSNKAGVRAFDREIRIWQASVRPKIMTYEGLVKTIANWTKGAPAPRGVIFDESSKIKTPTAKRSIAALHLANAMRDEHESKNVYVVLMSGSPAPKSPADWWMQCEIACPGFLREGHIEKFKRRLAIVVNKENLITGGTYPELLAWLDDARKCSICGQLKEHENHDSMAALLRVDGQPQHEWTPSKNEVSFLYERMKGLVLVKFKKDCLKELPEKQYRVVQLTPTKDVLRAASLITDTAPTAIQALTLLRELSDGFQYKDEKTGEKECEVCRGQKQKLQPSEVPGSCPRCTAESRKDCLDHQPRFEEKLTNCDGCQGTGKVPVYTRKTVEIPCPKEELFKELLDDHEEIGRLVVFAGFTGAIDRLVRVALEQQWGVIRVDGRGWSCLDSAGKSLDIDPMDYFQKMKEQYPQVVFVAHPKSGGTSITLTASPTIFYYSNSFDGEDRIQSEDRIHRLGMDVNRGASIIDAIHLPSDQHVLENVKKKRDLQSLTLGEVKQVMREAKDRVF